MPSSTRQAAKQPTPAPVVEDTMSMNVDPSLITSTSYNGHPANNHSTVIGLNPTVVGFDNIEFDQEDFKVSEEWINSAMAGISELKLDYHNQELDELMESMYKYNEDISLRKVKDYIDSTYGQHYVGRGEIQTVDFWESLGSLETTARDTAIKYLARYGKKGGKNEKDLLKAIHYIILMMYASESEKERGEADDSFKQPV